MQENNNSDDPQTTIVQDHEQHVVQANDDDDVSSEHHLDRRDHDQDELVDQNDTSAVVVSSSTAFDSSSSSPHRSCWHVVSHSIFVAASCFYLALSLVVLDEYRFYRGVPADVFYATDDATWWQYYNDTDAMDDVVLNATDDTTLMEWYNNSFYPQDDVVFQVNANKETTIVNQYMILYFLAAMGFVLTGILEFWLSTTVTKRMLYGIFIVAAIFGVVSSMLVVANELMSSVFNVVSVHLFAVEAVSIMIHQFRRQSSSSGNLVLLIGHLSLVIGTVMDVVLSYYFVLNQATLNHVYVGVAAACFWLLCSLIYLWNSVSRCRRHDDNDDDNENDNNKGSNNDANNNDKDDAEPTPDWKQKETVSCYSSEEMEA
jgi:uncharacterized membrane protein HdeD (DUF308 family)